MAKHNRPSTKTGKVWNTGKPPVIFHDEVRHAVDRLQARQASTLAGMYKAYYVHWTQQIYDAAQVRLNKQYPDFPHRNAAIREWRRATGHED